MTHCTSPSHPRIGHRAALTVFVACTGFAGMAFGQTADSPEQRKAEESSWGLGLGASVKQSPYLGIKKETQPIPLISYQSRWIKVTGATAEFRIADFALTPSQTLSPGIKLKYEDAGYKASDSTYLLGMEDRKGGLWGGLSLEWKTPIVKITANVLGDASGKSKGKQTQLQADRRFQIGSFGITPRVQAQWLDEKYVDYYYGVRASEATASRATYIGQAATTVQAGLLLDYTLARHHTFILDLSSTSLPDEIKMSPIVGRSSVARVSLGYSYRF